MNNLSVSIITLNEEKDLLRCLSSLKGLSEDIVVIDSGSADKTLEIAKEFGAKVYQRSFDSFANQKNFAADKCSNKWIFSIDADEEVPPELFKEIQKAISNDEYDAYSMPRKNIIFGKFIEHSRWQPELDRQVWLWQKNKGGWAGLVHEKVIVKGKVGKLENPKIHYQYETVKEFMEMMNRYSDFEAEEKVKKGVRFSYIQIVFQPHYNFLVRYVYRLGFLDGWRGFILSYLMGIYHLELWVKIWERTRKEEV